MRVYLYCLAFLLSGCGSNGYEIRGNQVIWTEWNEAVGTQEKHLNVDIKSFKVLKHERYAKDNNRAFYRGDEIIGADAESFQSLWKNYAADNNHAFIFAQQIPNALGKTFHVVDGTYSRDGKDYYYYDQAMNVCDYNTFKIFPSDTIQDSVMSADKTCAYYKADRIPVKDIVSFQVINASYTKDKHHIYFQNQLVMDADAKTFTVNKKTFLAQDKFGCFSGAERYQCP